MLSAHTGSGGQIQILECVIESGIWLMGDSWVVRKVVGKVVGHKMRKKPRFYLKKCFTKIIFYHNLFLKSSVSGRLQCFWRKLFEKRFEMVSGWNIDLLQAFGYQPIAFNG